MISSEHQLELLPPVSSQRAAHAIAPAAKPLRDQVLELLQATPRTADECAAALRADVLSIRPRLSELVAMDIIEDTGDRRPNHRSGKPATVWRAKA